MILFFYGPDTYRLKNKVRKLKEKFIDSSLGDTNLAVLDGENTNYAEIVRQTLALPFLARKRLVILENALKSKKEMQEKLLAFLPKIPETTVLVFVEEGMPDRRTALFKKLNQPKQAEEFKLLEGEALRRHVRAEFESRGAKIDSIALSKLIEYVGPDLWRMQNEIGKLADYNPNITSESIDLLVNPEIKANIFNLIEQTSAKNSRQAVKELYRLLDCDQSEFYILTMLVYQYRNLLIVKDLENRGETRDMAKKSGLHPFVLQKMCPLLSKYSLVDLKKIYKLLLGYDWKIKVGKIEPKLALELAMFELTR